MNRSPSISEDFSTRFVEFIDEGRNIMTKALLITALITIILWCVPKTSVAGCALTTTLLVGTIILGAFYHFLKKKHDKEAPWSHFQVELPNSKPQPNQSSQATLQVEEAPIVQARVTNRDMAQYKAALKILSDKTYPFAEGDNRKERRDIFANLKIVADFLASESVNSEVAEMLRQYKDKQFQELPSRRLVKFVNELISKLNNK